MKSLIVAALVALVGYLAWRDYRAGQLPEEITDPVYGEVRVSMEEQGRELEMAAFSLMPSHEECQARARKIWEDMLADCPICQMQPVQCKDELPRRYARLFEDVPIPSYYLSLSPGAAGEREARMVVYGLTDEEGKLVCEQMRKIVLGNYSGTGHCVAPSDD